jgi:hypothetical protein
VQTELFHLLNITVTLGAGAGNIIPVNGGFRIPGGYDMVSIAMAILAGGRLVAALAQRFSMRTLKVNFRFEVVAPGTIHLIQRRVVFGVLDIVVAAGALVVGMNRALKKRTVDERFCILFTMAFEAIGVVDLSLRCEEGDWQPKGSQDDMQGWSTHSHLRLKIALVL